MPRLVRFVFAVVALLACSASVALAADDPPLRKRLDTEIQAVQKKHNIPPAGKADDATFLRRIYLDLVGTIPTFEEAQQFLADSDPAKREKLIDKLLADPRFAEHQANVWDLVLFGRSPSGGDATRKREGFKKWLAEKWAANTPFDRLSRELLTQEQDESTLFFVQFRNQPEEATTAVARIFLGTQLQCARCHDHPFDVWTQKDFYGMTGFFVRIMVLEEAGMNGKRKFSLGEKSSGDVLFTGPAKEQKPGQKGEPVKPKFLDGSLLDEPALPADFKEPDYRTAKSLPKPYFSRKDKFADWLTTPTNPYFAKAVVNRIWGQFLGRGIVHPVDDIGGNNPPFHPELLQTLATELVAHQFDAKWLIRELVNSDSYQLAATGPVTDAFPQHYERARVRPLTAEELMATIRTATIVDPALIKQNGDSSEYFLRYFGEPMNGQGDFQGSLNEHLFLNNSSNLRQFIQRRKGNLMDILVTSQVSTEDKVDRLFLSVLTRFPRPEEKTRFVNYLNSETTPQKAEPLVEESIWVLLNTSEFRFNH